MVVVVVEGEESSNKFLQVVGRSSFFGTPKVDFCCLQGLKLQRIGTIQ